jgi:hypothetical protein
LHAVLILEGLLCAAPEVQEGYASNTKIKSPLIILVSHVTMFTIMIIPDPCDVLLVDSQQQHTRLLKFGKVIPDVFVACLNMDFGKSLTHTHIIAGSMHLAQPRIARAYATDRAAEQCGNLSMTWQPREPNYRWQLVTDSLQ